MLLSCASRSLCLHLLLHLLLRTNTSCDVCRGTDTNAPDNSCNLSHSCNNIPEYFRQCNPNAVDLLMKMLTFNPKNR